MKNFTLGILVFFISINADANIRRVQNSGINMIPGVDYTTFYGAYQASNSGDTVYVFAGIDLGSGWIGNSGNPTIVKKIALFSKGYWLDSASTPKGNPGLQRGASTAFTTRDLYFLPGSDGSILQGFNFEFRSAFISANNIKIQRNNKIQISLGDANVSNLLVEGNYRVGFFGVDNASNIWTDVFINNNLIYQMRSMPLKTYIGRVSNNVWAWDESTANNGGFETFSEDQYEFNSNLGQINLRNGQWLFENNLLVCNTNDRVYYLTGTGNSTLNFNVAISASYFNAWPAGLGGVGNILLTSAQVPSIFEAFPAIATSSADGRYRLKANSPALAGSPQRPTATVDAGMYGGPTPYKLGMIPSIPTIYSISSPQGNTPTGSTMQINISTRSNN